MPKTCTACGHELPDAPNTCIGCGNQFEPKDLNEASACAECTTRAERVALAMLDAKTRAAKARRPNIFIDLRNRHA